MQHVPTLERLWQKYQINILNISHFFLPNTYICAIISSLCTTLNSALNIFFPLFFQTFFWFDFLQAVLLTATFSSTHIQAMPAIPTYRSSSSTTSAFSAIMGCCGHSWQETTNQVDIFLYKCFSSPALTSSYLNCPISAWQNTMFVALDFFILF